jgi:hypothetical protein
MLIQFLPLMKTLCSIMETNPLVLLILISIEKHTHSETFNVREGGTSSSSVNL